MAFMDLYGVNMEVLASGVRYGTEEFSQREIDDLSTDELKIHDDLSDMPMWGLTDSDDTEDLFQRKFDKLKVELKRLHDLYLRARYEREEFFQRMTDEISFRELKIHDDLSYMPMTDLDDFSQRMPRKNYDQQTESKDRERDFSKRNRVSTGEYLNHRVPFYTKAVLFGITLLASRFGSILTYADFIPIRPNSNFCNIDYSKLPSTCGSDKARAFHCVFDSDGQLGICCAEKLWIPKGHCPFFSKEFGVLDYQPCPMESCSKDRDWYLSTDTYIYPGCLTYSTSSVEKDKFVTVSTSDSRKSVPESSPVWIGVVVNGVVGLLLISIVLVVIFKKGRCAKACKCVEEKQSNIPELEEMEA